MGSTTIPTFLGRSAAAARGAKSNERILVVVQLLGGNDGLNTVVPHGIDGYNRGPPGAAASRGPAAQDHRRRSACIPSMGGMAKILERGRLAVVQGVGYPNPDRSHFRSMEIWETASVKNDAQALETGWLGRALDARLTKPGDDPPGLHVGERSMPLALRTRKTEVPSVESLESYKLQLAGTDQEKQAERTALNQLAGLDRRGDDPLLGFISRTTLAAYESSGRLEQLAQKKQNGPKYPNFGLARRLELIAQIIKADFGTRIFYTSLDGFDTHANQLGTHAALLTELSDSIAAFHDDLAAAGQGDRVAAAHLQRIRPPGPGKRVAGDRSWRGRTRLHRRTGRQARTDWQPPQPRRSRRRRPEVSHRLPLGLRRARRRLAETGRRTGRRRRIQSVAPCSAGPDGQGSRHDPAAIGSTDSVIPVIMKKFGVSARSFVVLSCPSGRKRAVGSPRTRSLSRSGGVLPMNRVRFFRVRRRALGRMRWCRPRRWVKMRRTRAFPTCRHCRRPTGPGPAARPVGPWPLFRNRG